MNFDLGPDELAVRDGIRDLCAGLFPIEAVREMTTVDRALWKRLGEAGVFSLRLPPEEGGAGLGMIEATIVFQELGRALVPGPLVGTHLAAGLVDGAATGDAVVGFAVGGADVGEHLGSLDALLVDGTTVVTDLEGEAPGTPLDPLTPFHRMAVPRASGERSLDAMLLTAALLAGIAARTSELATTYAKEREQFGRPIGSFQAVKHMCADTYVRAEVCRAQVDAAACMFAEAQASRHVASAFLLSAENAVQNAKTCIQVHGGMGFTWEVDVHLYLKRAAALSASMGGTGEPASAVAEALIT